MKPKTHNPDGLTRAQVGRRPWRLLDRDEIQPRCATRKIQSWSGELGCWIGRCFFRGASPTLTYRTRLTRRQLAALG